MAQRTAYSDSNFAYGSTLSWLALFESAPVQAAIGGAEPPSYLVLGSSLGSLVVYGACVYGLPSRGIELMPALASRAAEVAESAGVVGARFECADMLACDLSGAAIVLLASQCWDRSLVDALAAKLLRELRDGALVLDYTAALGERRSGGGGGSGEPPYRRFALQCTVSAPVSWDGAHRFWVWAVESV